MKLHLLEISFDFQDNPLRSGKISVCVKEIMWVALSMVPGTYMGRSSIYHHHHRHYSYVLLLLGES